MQPILSDFYSKDDGGHPDVEALAQAGAPWCGVLLKVSEGTYYTSGDWLKDYWTRVRAAGIRAHRYGLSWFRAGYHYFRVDQDPVKQADLFLSMVQAAGGWDLDGDLWPVVDVETAEQPPIVSAQQIVDSVSKFSERLATAHGRRPVLYAGSFIRDHRITDHMGCQYLITAAYGSALPAKLYVDMGWPLDKLLGWQYEGTDGYSGPSGYPRTSPAGAGPQDLTAITICNGATPDEQLAWIAAHLSS